MGLTTPAATVLAIPPTTSGAILSDSRLKGLMELYLSQSYPVKYMMFAGTAIASVGDRPRHKLVIPSFLAIFRSPSNVELIVRRWVSSTAHSVPATSPTRGAAIQYSALLLAKKTSRQHAVTPRFGGGVLKVRGEEAASFETVVRGDSWERG